MSSYVHSDSISISSVSSVSLSPPPYHRNPPSPTSPLARGRLPSPLGGTPLGINDLEPPASPSLTEALTLVTNPNASWRPDSPRLPSPSRTHTVVAVDVPPSALRMRTDSPTTDDLLKLRMYLQDARLCNPVFHHTDVDSPLYSTYLAFIHVSRLTSIASGLLPSADADIAFQVSQITATRVAVEQHLLTALFQLGMLEFIVDLDRFLAESTIYSTPLTIPSSPPGLPRPPLHLHVAEVEAVSPEGTLPLLRTPSASSSPLGTAEVDELDKMEAMFNSVSVHSDEEEHLENTDPAYHSPPPSPSIASTPSASSLPLNARETAVMNSAEARLDRELDLPVDRTHRLYPKACFSCRRLSHIRVDCPDYKCPLCLKPAPGHLQGGCPLKRRAQRPSPSASSSSSTSSRSSHHSARSGRGRAKPFRPPRGSTSSHRARLPPHCPTPSGRPPSPDYDYDQEDVYNGAADANMCGEDPWPGMDY